MLFIGIPGTTKNKLATGGLEFDFSQKTGGQVATIVLSSLVSWPMIQNGYRSSITHPASGEG